MNKSFLFYLFALLTVICMGIIPVHAIPYTINYQGIVEVNGSKFSGTGYFRFAFVGPAETQYWSNDGFEPPVTDVELEVTNGLVNVILGDVTLMNPIPVTVFDSDDLYLRIWFDDGVNGPQQLEPDQKLTSTGFAYKSGNSNMLNNQLGSYYLDWNNMLFIPPGFADGEDDDQPDNDSEVPNDISINNGRLYAPSGPGNVGINTTSPGVELDVNGAIESNDGVSTSTTSGHAFYVSNTGGDGLHINAAGGDGIYVDDTTDAGIYISDAGTDGIHIHDPVENGILIYEAGTPPGHTSSSSADGLEINGAQGHGVFVGEAGSDGFNVDSAGDDGLDIGSASDHGIYIGSSGDDGLYIDNSSDNGVYVDNSSSDGFRIREAGNPSTTHTGTYNNGVEVNGAEGEGVYVGYAGENGIYAYEIEETGVEVYWAGLHGFQVWNAAQDGVSLIDVGGDGVFVSQAGDYGLNVNSANDGGVYVGEAGNPTSTIYDSGRNGFQVDGAEDHGLFIGHTNQDGIQIADAGGDGIYVDHADHHGISLDGCGSRGIQILYCEDDGIYMNEVGNAQGENVSYDTNAIQINGVEDNGLYIGYAGDDGVHVEFCWFDGVYGYGLNGVVGQSRSVEHEWGVYSDDKVYASGGYYPAKQGVYCKNTGETELKPGDIVSLDTGCETATLGAASPVVMHVRRTDAQNKRSVIGVVEYAVAVQDVNRDSLDQSTPKEFRFKSYSVSPGDYMTAIVFGPMDVNIDPETEITCGAPLTASENGRAREVRVAAIDGIEIAENVGIIGKAMEDSNGSGMIKVFVNCR